VDSGISLFLEEKEMRRTKNAHTHQQKPLTIATF
jgi:hypothetical protein